MSNFKMISIRYMGFLGAIGLLMATLGPAEGGRVGNTGDFRKMMFTRAQWEAQNWTSIVQLNQDLVQKAEGWANKKGLPLLQSPDLLAVLADDIKESIYIFRDKQEGEVADITSCAWTNDPTLPSLNHIIFILDRCEPGLLNLGGQDFANHVVIHESVHHLLRDSHIRQRVQAVFTGTREQQLAAEEEYCDSVADGIQAAFEILTRESRPHWKDLPTPVLHLNEGVTTLEPRGFHAFAWTGIGNGPKVDRRFIVWGGCQYDDMSIFGCGGNAYYGNGAIYNSETRAWRAISGVNAPSARAGAGFQWSQDHLFVWGGCVTGDACDVKLNDGGIYYPSDDHWERITTAAETPSPRVGHTVVAIPQGKGKLFVWGGRPQEDNSAQAAEPLNTGSIYDVAKKSWKSIPVTQDTPAARGFAAGFYTGKTTNSLSSEKVFVWGGCTNEISDGCSKSFADGAFFDLELGQWKKLPSSSNQPKARHNHSVLYVPEQQRMYIFGGVDGRGEILNDGWILDLNTMAWYQMANIADGRFLHKAVWAGDRMFIFGGKQSFDPHDGLASEILTYKPALDGSGEWTTRFETYEKSPLKVMHHSLAWTGYGLIVWGGQTGNFGFTNAGSIFYPGR
jgi:hypothetical protein